MFICNMSPDKLSLKANTIYIYIYDICIPQQRAAELYIRYFVSFLNLCKYCTNIYWRFIDTLTQRKSGIIRKEKPEHFVLTKYYCCYRLLHCHNFLLSV